MCAWAASTVLVTFKLIDNGSYVAIVLGTVGAYIGRSIMEDFSTKGG
jgi:uncharacterized membrane protein YeaQ/YmgE (transglycosylase-associated protein family)